MLAAGVGWGAAQIISAAATGWTGLAVLVAARLTAPRSTTNVTQTVHHRNEWWGRSTTNL